MCGFTEEREADFVRLYVRHQDCVRPCTQVPDGPMPTCPCFPYDSTEDASVDYCAFQGVNRCKRWAAHLEQLWCDDGASLDFALSLRLV